MITPKHYTLYLDPRRDDRRFGGEVVIDIGLGQPAERLTLHAKDLTILDAWIDDLPCCWNLSQDQLVLTPSAPLSRAATIKLIFSGVLNQTPRGLYLGTNFIATQMQPTHARRVFPCIDEPGSKTTFDVTVCVDAAQTAISNAVIESEHVSGPRRQITFARTAPIPTHLLAIAIGAFVSRSLHSDSCEIASPFMDAG